MNIYDSVSWSTIISGDSVNVTIPPDNLTEKLYRLTCTDSGTSDSTEIIVTAKFDPRYIQNPVHALITAPFEDLLLAGEWKPLVSAMKAFARFPNYVLLYGKKCNWKNFSFLIKNSESLNINYWYHAGHGHYRFSDWNEQYQRTYIDIWEFEKTFSEAHIWSYLGRDFGPITPSWYHPLPSVIETDPLQHSILSLHNPFARNFKIVYFNSCFSAFIQEPDYSGQPNDMALALGIYNDYSQVYLGWTGTSYYTGYLGYYDLEFSETFWEELAKMNSVQNAWWTAHLHGIGSMPAYRTLLITPGDPQAIFMWD
jgi:hypothetical protein